MSTPGPRGQAAEYLTAPSTAEEREALRARRQTEPRPLVLSDREVVVLDDMLDLAETALAGAGLLEHLPK